MFVFIRPHTIYQLFFDTFNSKEDALYKMLIYIKTTNDFNVYVVEVDANYLIINKFIFINDSIQTINIKEQLFNSFDKTYKYCDTQFNNEIYNTYLKNCNFDIVNQFDTSHKTTEIPNQIKTSTDDYKQINEDMLKETYELLKDKQNKIKEEIEELQEQETERIMNVSYEKTNKIKENERINERKNIYEVDKQLYDKIKMEKIDIPELFKLKFNIFKTLENNNELNNYTKYWILYDELKEEENINEIFD